MKTAIRQAARAEFVRSFAESRAPAFADAELSVWIKEADALVQLGELEVGAHAVRSIRRAWPDSVWGANVDELFALLPPADPKALAFADQYPKAFQVAPREGADAVIMVFCGAQHRVGMPVPMLHRWLSRERCSVIYLRDPKAVGYLAGVEEIGPDLQSTLAGLKTVIANLAARRVFCFGISLGGHGALRYGLDLGAEAVICMGGLMNLRASFNEGLHYASAAKRIEASFPDAPLDLRELHGRAARRPKVSMVYAEHNWDDRIHAEHMAGLDGVSLVQVDGTKNHNVAIELIRDGRFEPLLQAMLAG
jgi:hypothetical protein